MVFADAGYWIALVNPSDDLHHHAKSVSASLAPLRIVTSEMVLTEVLNAFSKKGSGLRKTTVDLMQDITTDSAIDVIPQTSERFRNALRRASFLIMQQQKILEALTHDRHFEQAGFIALLR